MIARMLFLFCSWGFGESNFKDSQESLLFYGKKPFLSGFPNINNFSFCHIHDHVKAFNFSPHNLCNPKSLIHKFLGSFDGDEAL